MKKNKHLNNFNYSLLLLSFIFCLLSTVISCTKKDNTEITNCKPIIVDTNWSNNSSSSINIISLQVEDGCLLIEVGYSGCDDGHDMDLYTNGNFAESFPPILSLSIVDNSPEDCLAYFTESFSFDLENINKLEDSYDKMWLNITNSDMKILYTK